MPAQRLTLSHGFGPYYTPESRLLILGSFPSVKSREQRFFYGHPRNRFWPVLAGLCGIAALVGIEFGLDRTELPDAFWYAVMVAVLAGFGWLEIWCVKKRFMQERMKHD